MKSDAVSPGTGDYLGNYIAKSSSRPVPQGERVAKFMLQAVARELAPYSRVRVCLRAVIPGRDTVEVWRKKRKLAYYRNLITCNRVWVCPVCASKISERRRQELSRLLNVRDEITIIGKGGRNHTVSYRRYYLVLATFTISHHLAEPLRQVMDRLQRAYTRTWGGRWAMAYKNKHRVIGMLRGLEITWGENGWHPHYHVLMIRSSANTPNAVKELDIDLTLRWVEAVIAVGGQASMDRGLDVIAGRGDIDEYPGKADRQIKEALAGVGCHRRSHQVSGKAWEKRGTYPVAAIGRLCERRRAGRGALD